MLEDCSKVIAAGLYIGQAQASAVIPDHKEWLVTMWHFGADASIEYSGEKFSASWEIGQNELIRVYSKEFHGQGMNVGSEQAARNKTRIRVEIQEYPQSTLKMPSKIYSTWMDLLNSFHDHGKASLLVWRGWKLLFSTRDRPICLTSEYRR